MTDEKLDELIDAHAEAQFNLRVNPLGYPLEMRQEAARAARAALREYVSEDTRRLDAERWQALVTSPRVSMLGGARFYQPGWLLAVEFYDDAPSGIARSEAVERLTEYADFRRASMKEHPDK